ncbi:PAS domain-containing protein [Sphingomonas oryzagri]
MDGMRGIDHEPEGREPALEPERPPAIGSDERRMHVRAYNFWVSMLGGRAYPSIEDLDPEHSEDFGPHSVLLDFTGGVEDPAITFLGSALRRECGLDHDIHTISDVPSRSLLSRLTDHYLQILANRAPIGFEAEFVSQRGANTMYRGILMPFSSDDDTIDFVYGVINWKEAPAEIATPEPVAIDDEPVAPCAPVWADGPFGALAQAPQEAPSSYGDEDGEDDLPPGHNAALVDHLAAARGQAEAAQGARLKSRAALYRALGLAYDFSLLADARPAEYGELLDDAGVRSQRRAPMTAVVKLIFGADVDKARATEFAATLAYARRIGLDPGALADHIEALPGGLKAMVAAERQARKPVTAPPSHAEIARAALRKVAAQVVIDLPTDSGEFVLLLARRQDDGRLAVIAPVPEEESLLDRAIRKITR